MSHHTLDSIQNRRGKQQQTTEDEEDIFAFVPAEKIEREQKHPRDENFWDMWQLAICPRFLFKSITFSAVVLQIVYFTVGLIFTFVATDGPNALFFLGLNKLTLQYFGIRMPFAIKADYWQL